MRSGKLFTKRLLNKTNSIPNWAKRFISTANVYILEESIVDGKNKILITYTRNLGLTKVMVSVWTYLICIIKSYEHLCLKQGSY